MAKNPSMQRPTAPRPEAVGPDSRRPSFAFLIFTVLCTGAGIIMLEVLGARIAGPIFGVSLYIWTALIAVTLLSLSVGYWLGGLLSDRCPRADAMYGLILGSAFLVALVPWIDSPVLEGCYRAFGGSWGIRLGALAAALLLFAPPLTLLGMVSPFAIKLALSDLNRTGKTAGSLYAISTVGSVAGTIVAGYVLIPGVGVSRTLLVITALLLAPPALWFAMARRWAPALAVPLCLLAGVSSWAAPKPALPPGSLILDAKDSLYGRIKVLDRIELSGGGTTRWLVVDGAAQTGVRLGSDELVSRYTQTIVDFLRLHPAAGKKVLLAGMGGGALVRALYGDGYEVDVVEIDPLVPRWAAKYFECDASRYRVICEDGRGYIRRTERKYDIVLFDVFSGSAQPFHFYSRESFEDARRVMNPGGILALNSIAFPKGPDSILPASLHKTAAAVFPESRIVLAYADESTNILNNVLMFFSKAPFAGKESALDGDDKAASERLDAGRIDYGPGEGIVITDDYNPVDRWTARVNEAWRARIYQDMGPAVLAY